LKKLQQRLSKKKKRSNRRKKAVKSVAKAHKKVRNQRKDFHQKEARILVETFETIIFGDLSMYNMVRRPKAKQDDNGNYLPNGASSKAGLNKSLLDAGWGSFIELVKHKAECAGVTVMQVDPKKLLREVPDFSRGELSHQISGGNPCRPRVSSVTG
jgi:putative transposase